MAAVGGKTQKEDRLYRKGTTGGVSDDAETLNAENKNLTL